MKSDIEQSAACRNRLNLAIAMVKDNPGSDEHFQYAQDTLDQMVNCQRSPLCVGCPFNDPCVLGTRKAAVLMAEKRGIACNDKLNNEQRVRLGELNDALKNLTATCTCPTHAVYNAWDLDAWAALKLGVYNACIN